MYYLVKIVQVCFQILKDYSVIRSRIVCVIYRIMHNKRTTCVWKKNDDPNTLFLSRQIECTCADPEGVQLWQRERIQTNTTISGPSSLHHQAKLYRCWWPNNGCWLDSIVIFQGIGPSIAKEPYSFMIYQVPARSGSESGEFHGSLGDFVEIGQQIYWQSSVLPINLKWSYRFLVNYFEFWSLV